MDFKYNTSDPMADCFWCHSLFVIPFLINRKVKVPEGTVLPEKCNSCVVDSCMVKSTSTLKYASVEDIKQKLRDEINKCDQKQNKRCRMKRNDYISWDTYFMGVAMLSSMRSKDPSTQVVLVL
jgi:hypothetical protein